MAFVPTTGTPTTSLRHSHTSSVCQRRSTFTSRPVTRRTHATTHSQTPRMEFGKTVKETILSNPNFSKLVELATSAGVDLDVSNCTLFAPNNAAFARLRPGVVDELFANPDKAAAVIARHVLPGRVLTSKQIKGCGFWDDVSGGPLGYEGLGAIVKIGNAKLVMESCNLECDNGTIHTIDTLLDCPSVKLPGIAKTYVPSIPQFSDSTVASVYPNPTPGVTQVRAAQACMPGTTGGRKAMGLVQQLPFWQYGPPFNAAKQEEYEPISIAQPEIGTGVDYQLMPPGTVIVTPDEVSASKLLPVSGMSKYIGQTKRLVEGDGQSNYSRLDN